MKIADAMKVNSSLTSLNLGYNWIHIKGTMASADYSCIILSDEGNGMALHCHLLTKNTYFTQC
jgi:hypothetical protein